MLEKDRALLAGPNYIGQANDMMPPSTQPKLPVVCFIILSLILSLDGLGTLGGAIILFNHFQAGMPIYMPPLLALNGLGGLILTVFCGIAVWKLLKQKPNALRYCGLTWALVAAFTVWLLVTSLLSSSSSGSTGEIILVSILEVLIGRYLLQARRPDKG